MRNRLACLVTMVTVVMGCDGGGDGTAKSTRDLLVEVAEASPDFILRASESFDGSEATITYPLGGELVTTPLTGDALAEFRLEDDGSFTLVRFDVDLDDFTVAGLDPGFTMPVDVSAAQLRLSLVDAAGGPVAVPEVHVDPSGAAWVVPTFLGSAHFDAEGVGALDYSRIDTVVEPITCLFGVAPSQVTATIDYEYLLSPPGIEPVRLHVHYTAVIPRP